MQTKYYKIVHPASPFCYITSRCYSAKNIPYGSIFYAQNTDADGYYIKSDKPVLHFCDNAFDTMLWHSIFPIPGPEYEPYFYEITPLDDIIKERCLDEYSFFQCGAYKIEFLHQIPKSEMFARALAEFNANRPEKIKMYPNIKIANAVAAWKQQQQIKRL